MDHYPDGVWLVELAALEDAALVPQTVAAVVNMREMPGQPIATALATILRRRSLLLVLDSLGERRLRHHSERGRRSIRR